MRRPWPTGWAVVPNKRKIEVCGLLEFVSPGKILRYTLDRALCGSQRLSKHFGEQKLIWSLLGIETRFLCFQHLT